MNDSTTFTQANEETVRSVENSNPEQRHGTTPSWNAIAALVLSLVLPVCGWMVTLSNRVAALEVKTETLATSAEMAAVKQQIEDWVDEARRERVDDSIEGARDSK